MTEACGSTNSGGRYGVDPKKTGHDAVTVGGKAENPLFVVIAGQGVEFLEAGAKRDLDIVETRIAVKEKVSKKAQVLTIGSGGKNLSGFASVVNDTGSFQLIVQEAVLISVKSTYNQTTR
ncbi:MAG: hypothetical protein GY866_06310 [Proteobacteria bacterium]|nr:hypothetical protein [Pseudomonadota bacterium]